MSSSPVVTRGATLEDFLHMPEIEEAPGQEYIDGRIETKPMANRNHARIAQGFYRRISDYAEPAGLGLCDLEVRYTFAGRSILPDASFQVAAKVKVRSDGTSIPSILTPPDIHIEVISPEQSVPKIQTKLLFSVANGCGLGVLVHPEHRTIDIYRPGRPPERLADDGAIDFAPVLPGLVVPVAEVFSWMVVRLRRPEA